MTPAEFNRAMHSELRGISKASLGLSPNSDAKRIRIAAVARQIARDRYPLLTLAEARGSSLHANVSISGEHLF